MPETIVLTKAEDISKRNRRKALMAVFLFLLVAIIFFVSVFNRVQLGG